MNNGSQMTSAPGVGARPRSWRPTWWLMVALESIVAASAVYGGIGLIVNGMGMPRDWLDGTPFRSWVLPGLFLLAFVALPMASAATAEVFGGRAAYRLSVVAGATLIGWIGAQVVILQRYFFLQPILLAAGGVVLVLAWLVHRGQPAPTGTAGKKAPS